MAAINEVLDIDLIDLNMDLTEKESIIKELSRKFLDQGVISDLKKFVEDVFLREKEGITGIGNHVAIPHGKSDSVKKPAIAIGKTNEMIEWESYDEQPVNLVFLIAAPMGKEGSEEHLKMLAQIAVKLSDNDTLQLLLKSKNEREFMDFLCKD
ncbi:PTS sugar transporter subunit IIA [Enterococcus hulanensis]|uniref:PTS sugar transporter subunit IIA n=1 Tax=Enterococcus hulanensis TaxID=2559929 RepID=UPI001A8EED28|nr:fructose PTS transporter subunit IIA [Enterococcus hulanensis]MBO0456007.1 PTS sugar transporter subunit IIA [Enterococcus hulanensis]